MAVLTEERTIELATAKVDRAADRIERVYGWEVERDGEGDALRDEEVKARFEEVVRIVERREAGKPASAS